MSIWSSDTCDLLSSTSRLITGVKVEVDSSSCNAERTASMKVGLEKVNDRSF